MNVAHADFILAAYGLGGVTIAAMIGFVVADYRALRRALARIEGGSPDGRRR